MKIIALSVVGAAAAVTLSACGAGSGYTAATTQPAGGTSSTGGLHTATTSLGRVVVDAQGRTVYLLTADSHDHATCDAGCQQYWPPVSAAGGGPGLSAHVGSAALPGGGTTATVAGHPVYTYVGDHKPGDVTGEGVATFGGTWYALSSSGTPVTTPGGSSGSSSPAYQPHGY